MEAFGKETIEKIQELTRRADKTVIGQDGKEYSFEQLHRVFHEPRPAALTVYSLDGIKDYLEANVDGLNRNKMMIHIVGHDRVELVTTIHGEANERHTVLQAVLDGDSFSFGRYHDQEEFIIGVRAMFQDTEDRLFILSHTAKVDLDKNMATHDDGITQRVEVKQGLRGSVTEAEDLKPIVSLKPFRTFRELDQPESEFLFRLRDHGGCEAALFESDGGAWKIDARKKIAEYLKDCGVAVIA